ASPVPRLRVCPVRAPTSPRLSRWLEPDAAKRRAACSATSPAVFPTTRRFASSKPACSKLVGPMSTRRESALAEIEAIAHEVAGSLGLEIVELVFHSRGKHSLLRIDIDRAGP